MIEKIYNSVKRRKCILNGHETNYARALMSEYLGRELTDKEPVHHKDENPLNDNINNLEVINRSKHRKLHPIKNAGCFRKRSWHDGRELTLNDISQIKRMIRDEISYHLITFIFKISKSIISQIKYNKIWSWVDINA